MGHNDYKVEINGKEKTMHANLLKKYLSRNEETTCNSRVPEVLSQMRDYLNVQPCKAVVEDYDYEANNGHDQDNLTGDEQASEDLPEIGRKILRMSSLVKPSRMTNIGSCS